MYLRLAALLIAAAIPGFGQCSFQLTPTSASFTNSSNDSTITVTASAPNCAWTSRSNTSWITLSFGQSGTGNGSVGYTVTQNSTPALRTGSLTIAGITFNVTQAAAACTFSFTPSSANVGSTGGTGTFLVSSPCTWGAVSNNPDWLTASGAATGNGTAQYSASANTTNATRVGTISIGTAIFNVTQSASCSFTLNPFNVQADPTSGATGTFTVTASSNSCAWTAVSANPDFISVTSGGSGTGNGTVGYSIQPNRTVNPRSGAITVGNTSFAVFQPGGQPCTYALSAANASFASTGGSGSFTVTSSCSWTPITASTWIAVNGSSTTGNGTVVFTVATNTSATARSGSISIGSQTFTVNQGGVACAVMAIPASIQAAGTGATGTIDVTAPDGCTWSAVSGANWITLGSASGTQQGSVAYTIAANTTAQTRTANITIANQVIPVSQDGATCGQALSPTSASVPAGAGSYSLQISTACAYTAVANAGWIKVTANASGTSGAAIGYSVSANTAADARSGTISVGSQTFTVSQSGAGCTLVVNPAGAAISAAGGSGTFNVTASGSCRWQPNVDAGWIHVTFQSVNGTGTVKFTADPTDSTIARLGNIVVADQTFQLRQAPRPVVQLTRTGVLNAASFVSGAVSPGEIITIFGVGLGADPGVPLQLTADGQSLTSSLAGTRVLFDGNAAPLIYTSATQVSAIVPFGITGNTSTQLQVEYEGFPSSSVTLDVVPATPALFTLDASGAGPGAILNQDATVNSATNPARKGSVIVLFGTGGGQTTPAGVDGQLTSKTLSKPVAPISVQVGGVDAQVQYAGAAPGLPAGVLQVNVQVPANAPSGPVAVILKVGSLSSPSNVTVALQ